MVTLTFVVAIVNIGLGFWLAMRIGFGPPTLTDAWDAFICFDPSRSGDAGFPDSSDLADHLGGFLADDSDEDLPIESMVLEEETQDKEEELDYDVSDLLDPIDPEYWNLGEKFVETSILKLVIAAIKNGVQATLVDTKLRESQNMADQELVRTSRDSLLQECRVYLDEQSQAGEALQAKLDSLDNPEVVREVNELLENQTEQLEATISRVEAIDLEGDPEVGVACLLDELNQLRVTRHGLLDVHNRLFLEIARSEEHLDVVDSHLLADHLTKLYNRIGLEVKLAEWFGKKRHKSCQLNAAIFDIQAFTEINNNLGILISDKILMKLAKELSGECGSNDLVGRFTGQQFMVVYSDIGPQAALKKAEQFRQTIQESIFLINEEHCSVELNLAFTEIKESDEDEQEIIKRLLEALAESKKAGPDENYMHDGFWTRLIESPPLKIKQKTFRI